MTLLQEAQELFEYARDLRRDFHRHPELGFKEFRTAGIVARELQALGLEVTTGVAETGVVALLEGVHPGPVRLARFDMDALPVHEQTGAEYASQTDGVMHACGHDGHVAIGLAVARLLHRHRDELAGTVKLVFQPAEEGLGGAQRMIRQGLFDDPRPQQAFGLHLWNGKPLGWIGAAAGPVMAAAETFNVRITGRGGHGALPHLAVDPVLAAAQVVSALQSIVARNVSPLETAVVTVAAMHAGDAFNFIPTHAELRGTIRTFDAAVRAQVLERFGQVVHGVTQAMGCTAEVTLERLTPAVVNDPQAAALVQQAARRLLPDCSLDTQDRTMGSEDMAYILEQAPGCFFFVGSSSSERGLDAPHHHPRFDFDEQALPQAVALMSGVLLEAGRS
ncbi:MAG: M20 family metallopeptidase [Chloroflexota bacterium]